MICTKFDFFYLTTVQTQFRLAVKASKNIYKWNFQNKLNVQPNVHTVKSHFKSDYLLNHIVREGLHALTWLIRLSNTNSICTM